MTAEPHPLDVLVLAGGRSSEREVSLASGEAVRTGLVARGHRVRAVEIGADGRWRDVPQFGSGPTQPAGEPLSVTPGAGALGADVVFPVLHGPFGEDGVTQGLLESLDVPYVGAGVAASAVAMDKLLFKELMARAGVDQVAHRGVGSAEWEAAGRRRAACLESLVELGFPQFVKPARLGSSVGITRVATLAELPGAIEVALAHDPRVIVEAASGGDEVECAVIGNTELTVSRPGRLRFGGDWYDYRSKYEAGGMQLEAPAELTEELEQRVRALAADVYRAVGCAGLARVDFFVEHDGRVLVNELNTLPGFTPTSVFAHLFEASGLPYGELLDRLLALAIERHAGERSFRF